MKADLSNVETHILDLPGIRVEYRMRFTETGIFAVLEIPEPLHSRRHRRALDRWRDGIHRPLESDPRPLQIVSFVAGQFASFGMETADGLVVFGEGSK